ncbi:MAG: phosphoribosylformylglycinamidine cyclo-ligase [Gammaproteobacteria bacterium]|nr:phosphoribosylformylglycinamidine cyclo-ligase [Gammaproteobacteria bacterium]
MGLTYRDAGVDIDAGNELVKRIAPATKRTRRDEQLTGLGGFAALATLPEKYREPVLVTATDGVGTKLKLAIDHGRHDGVGQDLVAMCANDVLVTGAEPFLFLDYFATAKLDVDTAERVIVGIAEGCLLAGCALVGGETAEMPGFYQSGDYDLAGFCVGVVERAAIVTGSRIAPGCSLIGLRSSGPHSNGYSLIRRVLDNADITPDGELLDQLLAPTRIYAKPIAALLEQTAVLGMAHITGGGFTENLPRMFGDHLGAEVDLDSWQRPSVFAWLQQAGNIDEAEMLRTFNCGIGFVLCVDADVRDDALEVLRTAGEDPVDIGSIVDADAEPGPGHIVITAKGHRFG